MTRNIRRQETESRPVAPRYSLLEYDLILGALLAAIRDAAGRNLGEQVRGLRAAWDKVRQGRDVDYPAGGEVSDKGEPS